MQGGSMDGSEQRKHERMKVRFPCELTCGRDRVSGTVRDLSGGGLSVQSDKPLDEGETVRVRLHPKGRPAIDIEALVWNVRRLRERRNGKVSARLGLVLSDATDAFLDLLKAATPTKAARSAAPEELRRLPLRERQHSREAATSSEANTASESEPPAPERRYSVRVKQSATSRTRTILIFAASDEDAKARALVETGTGWSVLQVARSAKPERP